METRAQKLSLQKKILINVVILFTLPDRRGRVCGCDGRRKTAGRKYASASGIQGEGTGLSRTGRDYHEREGLKPWEQVYAATGIADYTRGKDICTEDVLKRADMAMYTDKVEMKAARME